jgi:hypothetical protein
MATFKYWLHRLHRLPLSDTNKTKELNNVSTIAENNYYKIEKITSFYCQVGNKKQSNSTNLVRKQKRGIFTFTGNDIRTATKQFKTQKLRQLSKQAALEETNAIKHPSILAYRHRTVQYNLIHMDCKEPFI